MYKSRSRLLISFKSNSSNSNLNNRFKSRQLSSLIRHHNKRQENAILIDNTNASQLILKHQQTRDESSKGWLAQGQDCKKSKTSNLLDLSRQKLLKIKTEGNTYHEKVVLGYSRAQMCDLVYDVAKYKDFVPFCINSEIIREENSSTNKNTSTNNNTNRLNLNLKQSLNLRMKTENNILVNTQAEAKPAENASSPSREKSFRARLEIGVPPIRESYISHVHMIRPDLVKAVSKDTRLFEYLINEWKFHPYVCQTPHEENCCIVEFFVSFKFRSLVYNNAATLFIDQVFGKMVNAFTNRAAIKYGRPSMQAKVLS